MKKLTLSLLTAVAVASPSIAGTTTVVSKEYKQTVVLPQPCFRDQEFALDLYYSFNDARPGSKRYYRDGSGGGGAFNFFFARYFGISVEGNWWNGATKGWDSSTQNNNNNNRHGRAVAHQLTGNLILRYPVELSNFCFAPYIFGGGGGIWNGSGAGFGDVGAGVEFRLTEHIGIFGDWRWNFIGKSRNDVNTTRGGVRFIF